MFHIMYTVYIIKEFRLYHLVVLWLEKVDWLFFLFRSFIGKMYGKYSSTEEKPYFANYDDMVGCIFIYCRKEDRWINRNKFKIDLPSFNNYNFPSTTELPLSRTILLTQLEIKLYQAFKNALKSSDIWNSINLNLTGRAGIILIIMILYIDFFSLGF